MSAPSSNDVLQAYLARVTTLKAAHERALDADELRAIASELGLTEADLAAVDAAAEAAHQRGRGHLAHGRWADAIGELETAAAIRPQDHAVACELAEAHLGRWRAEGAAADREAAGRHARRALELEPGWQRGFALLNELDAPRRRPFGPARVAAWAIVLLALGTVGAYYLRPPAAPPSAPPLGDRPPAGDHGGSEPAAGDRDARPAAAAEVEIPLALAPGPKAAGLVVTPRLCRLNNYPERSFVTFAAEVRNDGRSEIGRLVMEVALLGEDGSPLAIYPTEVAGSQTATQRPGDTLLLSGLRQTTPALRKVRLTVLARDEAAAPASYGTTPVAPLEWAIVKPAHLAIEVRERALGVNWMKELKAEPIAIGQFELHNKGGAIRTLRLEMALLDAAGRRLGGYERLVVSGEGMALQPGEVRLSKWYVRVPQAFSRYKLRVLEVE